MTNFNGEKGLQELPQHQRKCERAPRNQTVTLSHSEKKRLGAHLLTDPDELDDLKLSNDIALGDFANWLPHLPKQSVDLLFLDPPYNLSKSFGHRKFSRQQEHQYTEWLSHLIGQLLPLLKTTATVYICGDWRTSHSIFEAASDKKLIVRNRITWEREKGRGAKTNWKNCSEDIWFCTMSNDYFFDADKVKLRRPVIAPYTNDDGSPKDWKRTTQGNFRDTHPSNLWTDISIPFWSMPENTDHPTQKSEKLLAKLILASSRASDFVFDPFAGSGTTIVVSKKLGRRSLGIEINHEYCLWALKRLEQCESSSSIQGYVDGVFWHRNSLVKQTRKVRPK